MRRLGMGTLAVHAGERVARPDYTPIATPICNAVTYAHDDMRALDAILAGERPGYVYSRFSNPTVAALEAAVAQLEATGGAVACGSGMAAMHLALLAAGGVSGASVLVAQDVYGGTHALLEQWFTAQGGHVNSIDMTDLGAAARAIDETKPTLLLVETISNPLLKVADVPALTRLAHAVGARVLVDNTFATPCLYRPVLHGADYVVHSATKYLGGHGDAMGGIVAASREKCQALRELQKLIGGILGPNEAWLILRGLKTLPLRVRQQCQNAAAVAGFLSTHSRVARVFYPGLPSHPAFSLCRRLFPTNLYGAIVSFEISGAGQEQVFCFMEALQLVVPAASLGDVYSLVLYPAHSSHRTLSDEERQRLSITPSLVRLSVGIEEASDIIADLAQALESVR